MGSKRKLAAILFTDIVGYSAQISADETRSLKERQRVERLIKDCAASHDGRVIKTIGDAVMLEFGSAVDAVSCAISIQERMQALNAELDATTPIQVRIGVHTGDVVEEDNDLFGNAVNIASRIQDMAAPGGICISREVYVQIRPILKLRCDVVTAPGKKPMPEAVEVLTVTNDLLTALPGKKTASSDEKAMTVRLMVVPVLVLVWMIVLVLWNYGGWGWLAGGVLLGGIVIAICRLFAGFVPALYASEEYTRKTIGRKLAGLAPLLILFVLGTGSIHGAYVYYLDHSAFGGWLPDSRPGGFAERNKGGEYKLLNRLSAFNQNPPQVSIDTLSFSGEQSDESAPLTVVSCLLGFAFLLCGITGALAAGRDTNYFKQNPKVSTRVQSEACGLTIAMAVTLAALFGFRDELGQISGPVTVQGFGVSVKGSVISEPRIELTVRTDIHIATTRLKKWLAEHHYEVPGEYWYALNTIPRQQEVGEVAVFRAWNPDPNARWHFGLGPVEQRSLPLYIECVASDKPAETVITITGTTVKQDSPLYVRTAHDFDSLAAAFADITEPGATKRLGTNSRLRHRDLLKLHGSPAG